MRVVSGRVEAVQGLRADVITSRAFAELADFVNWTMHLLQDGGCWAAMKGVYPAAEIDSPIPSASSAWTKSACRN